MLFLNIVDLKYEEIDDFLEQVYENEDFIEYDDYEVKNFDELDNGLVITSGPICRVVDLNLIFVEGLYFIYIDRTKLFEADWTLTLIYEDTSDDDFNVENYIYFEEDSPSLAIHNFLSGQRFIDKNS